MKSLVITESLENEKATDVRNANSSRHGQEDAPRRRQQHQLHEECFVLEGNQARCARSGWAATAADVAECLPLGPLVEPKEASERIFCVVLELLLVCMLFPLAQYNTKTRVRDSVLHLHTIPGAA
jgi:hypothetical protein